MTDNKLTPKPTQPPRRKWGALRFLASVSVALFGLISGGTTFAQTARLPTDCPRIVPQPVNWVVRVECNGMGEPQYIEHKWPFGSPDNIKSIRVPWGYRHLLFGPSAGAQLMDNGHKESMERGYGGMFIWALLPDVTPHAQRVPPVVDSAGEFDLVKIQVTPVINKFYPVWDKSGWLSRVAKTRFDGLNRGPLYKDIPKIQLDGRYGLKRIGPERVVLQSTGERDPTHPGSSPHNDLWFDGETPEKSDTVMICGSDYRRDGTKDPDNFPRSLCEMSFGHDGLNAAVHTVFWKKHHADWRVIQDRITALLNSFKMDIKSGE